MFNFVDVDLREHVEVEPVTQDGTRFYPIPGADKYYPSVTSITSFKNCLLYTSPSPRDQRGSRMPSSA